MPPTDKKLLTPEKIAERRALHEPIVDYYSKKRGLDPSLVKALIHHESQWYEKAKGGYNSRGGRGLMQLGPLTIEDEKVVNPEDPEENIAAGTLHLKKLFNKFKEEDTTLAAYHIGRKGTIDMGPEEAKRQMGKYIGNIQSTRKLYGNK